MLQIGLKLKSFIEILKSMLEKSLMAGSFFLNVLLYIFCNVQQLCVMRK